MTKAEKPRKNRTRTGRSKTDKEFNKLFTLEAVLDKKLDRKMPQYFTKQGFSKVATTRDKPENTVTSLQRIKSQSELGKLGMRSQPNTSFVTLLKPSKSTNIVAEVKAIPKELVSKRLDTHSPVGTGIVGLNNRHIDNSHGTEVFFTPVQPEYFTNQH